MHEGLGLVKMVADYIYLLKYYRSLMGVMCCANPHKTTTGLKTFFLM